MPQELFKEFAQLDQGKLSFRGSQSLTKIFLIKTQTMMCLCLLDGFHCSPDSTQYPQQVLLPWKSAINLGTRR